MRHREILQGSESEAITMNKLNQWLMLLSHLGILAGIVLVGIQLKQDTELTRIQIFSDATNTRIQMHGAMMGEDPAPVIMKSLVHPEDLSLAELRIMDAYLLTAVNEARLRLVLAREGLRFDTVEEENILLFYFGNTFAQAWWSQFTSDGEDMNNDINAELDRIITSAPDSDMTRSFFESLGGRLGIKSTENLENADLQE